MIPYTRENRTRVERLCHAEECRSARKLDPAWSHEYVRPFDAARWKPLWEMSGQDRVRAIWRRILENKKKTGTIKKSDSPPP